MRQIPGLILGIMAGVLLGLTATAQDLDGLLPLAKAGNADAQNNLGDMYSDGEGVPQNYGEAVRWYRLAAEQEYSWAQYNLGWMYLHGEGLPQDNVEALNWIQLAVGQDNIGAQTTLGNMYYEGNGVPQDYGEAVKWYRLAAEQGDNVAQYELGNMYYNGIGVPQNYILAHAWANLASANGYPDAPELRDSIASYLTPSLVVEAQKLAGCFQLGQALEECN